MRIRLSEVAKLTAAYKGASVFEVEFRLSKLLVRSFSHRSQHLALQSLDFGHFGVTSVKVKFTACVFERVVCLVCLILCSTFAFTVN